jgi:threonine synthase
MRFVSTRGLAPEISFREAVVSGLAPDDGLYMPAHWPAISEEERSSFAKMRFPEVAARILARFAESELQESELVAMATRAYAPFDVAEVAPLRGLGGEDFLLELFHGPTLAFKDIAMRLLAELYGWALEGSPRGKTIVGATSGDTGGAAVSAFAGKSDVEVFMLHPKGRVSDVQRRMMTSVISDNIVNIAVEGDFDDCQRIVKALFARRDLAQAFDLGGVNSINFIRLAAQAVYYFTATAALGRPASFVVPTGNFGDVFAGYGAARMGLPIKRLVVAVNRNDILKRGLDDGVYEPRSTTPTSSPSMDIQVASNFERLLFEAANRDAATLRAMMDEFARERHLKLSPAILAKIRADFVAERADEAEVAGMIAACLEKNGVLVDPHTAVGLVALDKLRRAGAISGDAIVLSTAHSAKFPDAVEAASGIRPALPTRYADIVARAERFVEAPADAGAIAALMISKSVFGRGSRR